MTTLRALTISAIALAAIGCGGKDDTDTAPPCEVGIEETFPAAGSTNAYYRGVIEAHLSDPDPTATITVDGVTGTSSLNGDEDVVYFTPDAPFSPNSIFSTKSCAERECAPKRCTLSSADLQASAKTIYSCK